MSNSATLTSLTALVRAWLNLTSVATVSDADIQIMLRSSMAQNYEKLVSRWRDQYVTAPLLINLVANQDTYPLPADFRAASCVFLTYAQGTANQVNRELKPFNMAEWKNLRMRGQLPRHPYYYLIVRNRLLIQPTPNADAANAIELWYIPQYSGPVRVTDTIDPVLPNGWERWSALDTCVQMAARMKLPESFQMFGAMLKEAEAVVMAAANVRDETAPLMRDVDDGGERMFDPGLIGSP